MAILITVAMRERGESAIWDAEQANILTKAVQSYERGGEAEVRRYLDEMRESLHVRAYLLGETGQSISGRDLPQMGRIDGPRSDPAATRHVGTPDAESVPATDTGRGQRAPIYPGGVSSAEWTVRARRSARVEHSDRDHFVRPGVLLVGAIFDLARSSPSSGHTATGCWRPDGQGGWSDDRRRDEMAQLVRDFDAMAERLEESVNAQSRLLNDISHELRSPLARLERGLGSGPPAFRAGSAQLPWNALIWKPTG